MWICPECNFKSSYGGICPCSDNKDHIVSLRKIEEEVMATKIKFTGNTERFRGQKRGKLLYAELAIIKELSDEFKAEIGSDAVPRGSAVLCVYLGEQNIPFTELRNYGSAALSKLKQSIGQVFEVDCPVTESKPVNMDFGNFVNYA